MRRLLRLACLLATACGPTTADWTPGTGACCPEE